MKIAVFPGSFDPFTIGHEEIVRKSLEIFDHVVILIGVNSNKGGFMSCKARTALITSVFKDIDAVSVSSYEGLTVDFCGENGADYIIRGLRNALDYSIERDLALGNFDLSGIETIYFNSSSQFAHISSTLVRDILKHDPARANAFAPTNIDYLDFVDFRD